MRSSGQTVDQSNGERAAANIGARIRRQLERQDPGREAWGLRTARVSYSPPVDSHTIVSGPPNPAPPPGGQLAGTTSAHEKLRGERGERKRAW